MENVMSVQCLTGGRVHETGEGASQDDTDTRDLFVLLGSVWQKIQVLMKQLRDVMQVYNEKKQLLGWSQVTNAFDSRKQAIDEGFHASASGGWGQIAGGVLSLAGVGVGAKFGMIDTGSAVGNGASQLSGGIASTVSADQNCLSEKEKALSDLQDKGAQSYEGTLNDTLLKARDIMQQLNVFGQQLISVLAQGLGAFTR